MTKKIINSLTLISLLVTCYLLLNTRFVQAQAEIPLSLANSRSEVTLDPGESYNFAMKLYNRGNNPILGNLQLVDFIVNDDKGTPIFLEGEENQLPNRYSAASWMSLPYDTLVLPPQDKVNFNITLNVPFTAKPGGHYAAVIFETTSDFPSQKETANKEAGSAITPRIAGLFYIRVNGPVTEKALISKLSIPSFSEYGPVKAIVRITNKGDTHIKPQGFLTVRDWFGKVITQSKLDEVNIFPEASRNYENKVGEHLMIGRYKLALSATYGEEGSLLEGYSYFWVIPWKLVLAISLTLAILIILLRNIRRGTILHQKDLERKLKSEEEEIAKLKEELKNK